MSINVIVNVKRIQYSILYQPNQPSTTNQDDIIQSLTDAKRDKLIGGHGYNYIPCGMAKPTQNIIHVIDTATAPTDKQ